MAFNSETWIAIASAVMAACALGVTVWQGYQNNKHNKMSVRPKLTTLTNFEEIETETKVSYELINAGVGPAIIKDFILFYDGKEISKNDGETYEKILRENACNTKILYVRSFAPGSSISTKECCTAFSFQYKSGQDISFMDRFNVCIHYFSIYEDEIFTLDTRKTHYYSGKVDDA